jgi:hypothetical protein
MYRDKTRRRRAAGTVGAFIGALVALAPAAQALPGGPWASSSSPLKVVGGGSRVDGASYGYWQGYREDQGRGSRVQNGSYHRHILDDVGGGDGGTYVKNSWYANKNHCYVSSWSDSGGSIGCSSGWWGIGKTQTGTTKSASWQYWEAWKGADVEANSMRDKIQTCENINLWPDICSAAYFLRGANL